MTSAKKQKPTKEEMGTMSGCQRSHGIFDIFIIYFTISATMLIDLFKEMKVLPSLENLRNVKDYGLTSALCLGGVFRDTADGIFSNRSLWE